VVDLLCRFWLPEARVELEAKRGRRHYEQWVTEGWITATPGSVIDYGFIRKEIVKLRGVYPQLQEIAFDPWNAQALATDLEEDDGFTMVELRQGFQSLTEPSKDFESRIADGKVRHAGNPVLTWMVGNAVVKRDASGNIKPDKEKAKDKIDGVVAAIMALARATGITGDRSSSCPYTETDRLL
jgi:phage terminase large subunit-like protein